MCPNEGVLTLILVQKFSGNGVAHGGNSFGSDYIRRRDGRYDDVGLIDHNCLFLQPHVIVLKSLEQR